MDSTNIQPQQCPWNKYVTLITVGQITHKLYINQTFELYKSNQKGSYEKCTHSISLDSAC